MYLILWFQIKIHVTHVWRKSFNLMIIILTASHVHSISGLVKSKTSGSFLPAMSGMMALRLLPIVLILSPESNTRQKGNISRNRNALIGNIMRSMRWVLRFCSSWNALLSNDSCMITWMTPTELSWLRTCTSTAVL